MRSACKRLQLPQPRLALAAGVEVRCIVEPEAGTPTVRLENTLRVLQAMGGARQVDGLPVAGEVA